MLIIHRLLPSITRAILIHLTLIHMLLHHHIMHQLTHPCLMHHILTTKDHHREWLHQQDRIIRGLITLLLLMQVPQNVGGHITLPSTKIIRHQSQFVPTMSHLHRTIHSPELLQVSLLIWFQVKMVMLELLECMAVLILAHMDHRHQEWHRTLQTRDILDPHHQQEMSMVRSTIPLVEMMVALLEIPHLVRLIMLTHQKSIPRLWILRLVVINMIIMSSLHQDLMGHILPHKDTTRTLLQGLHTLHILRMPAEIHTSHHMIMLPVPLPRHTIMFQLQ